MPICGSGREESPAEQEHQGIFEPDSDVDNDSVLVSNPNGTTLITSEWDLSEGANGVTLADLVPGLSAALPRDELALYLNAHTADAPGGAIRGQLVAVPEPSALLLLGFGLALVGKKLVRSGNRGPARCRSYSLGGFPKESPCAG